MKITGINYILTDIEGTTTSVSFVYDTLFPYFRKNIGLLKAMLDNQVVQHAFKQTVELSLSLENKKLNTVDDIINTLYRWSKEDRKLTPLKTLQGIIWKNGYESGAIKGHVYDEVKDCLNKWKDERIALGVFSSGSIEAQKLLFGFSDYGDLTKFFSNYFDTNTGGKRESTTYERIAETLEITPNSILFLSDIKEELLAAKDAGMQTVQLLRESKTAEWENAVHNFNEIKIDKEK